MLPLASSGGFYHDGLNGYRCFLSFLSRSFPRIQELTNKLSRCPQNEGRRDQFFGPVTTMKVGYPHKTATIQEDDTVLPRPPLHCCSSFPYSAMEGWPPNAEIAAT